MIAAEQVHVAAVTFDRSRTGQDSWIAVRLVTGARLTEQTTSTENIAWTARDVAKRRSNKSPVG